MRNRNAMWMVAVVGLMFCGSAFATGSGSAMPWDGGLTVLQKNLSGPTAGVISIIALFGAGAALVFGGEMNDFVKRLIYAIIAVALLVGGNAFLTSVGLLGAVI